MCRLQFFGDDHVNSEVQYQYSMVGTSIINGIRMRFDLEGNMGDVILPKNARIVVESAYKPALTNATSRIAVLRLITSTEDNVFDTKKSINGNPLILYV